MPKRIMNILVELLWWCETMKIFGLLCWALHCATLALVKLEYWWRKIIAGFLFKLLGRLHRSRLVKWEVKCLNGYRYPFLLIDMMPSSLVRIVNIIFTRHGKEKLFRLKRNIESYDSPSSKIVSYRKFGVRHWTLDFIFFLYKALRQV